MDQVTKEQPRIYEPSKLMNCALGGTVKKESSVDATDNIWLTRFHTIRNYAICRIIDKELPILKRAFMRSAKFGAHCTALLRAKDFHRETVTYLHKMGFTFIPELGMSKNNDGSCIYYHACLPVCCEDKKMNVWIYEVREVYFKAQKALIERHCSYIKQKFENAAKKHKSTITIHQNYCLIGGETMQTVTQRYGCEIQKHQQPNRITLTIADQV